MQQRVGFIIEGHEHKVCKLKTAKYGLKQSCKQWNLRFIQAIILMSLQ